MNPCFQICPKAGAWTLGLAAAMFASQIGAIPPRMQRSDSAEGGAGAKSESKTITIKRLEPSTDGEHGSARNRTWLGVSTEEVSEALAAQLGLDKGVGLVVTYLQTNSPAAKAGLQKNDVLVQFGDQSLVLPAQLRKLVQARKDGDQVDLTYFRGGKREKISATLGKTSGGIAWFGSNDSGNGMGQDWEMQLRELPLGDALREQMHSLHDTLGNLKIDKDKIQVEVRRSMEEARKAMNDAMKQATKSGSDTKALHQALMELHKAGMSAENKASVVVRNTGKSTRSIVQSDDSGCIVIISNPKRTLTAHDASGKLIFDGEIETQEQQDKVPRDLWEKVEPLLKKSGPALEEEDEQNSPDPKPDKENSLQINRVPQPWVALG